MDWIKRHIRRWRNSGTFILLVIFLSLLAVQGKLYMAEPAGPEMDEAVVWHDARLEALVRSALNKWEGGITPHDMREIRVINASGMGIENVEDFANFTRLYYLDLSGNRITDISPLSVMDLTYLDLSDNEITSIKGLSRMASLHGIDISGNPVSDIRVLCYLNELYELTVSPSSLKNENPLRWMSSLCNLELTEPLKDESVIKDLKLLKRLVVEGENLGIYYDYNELSWWHGALKSEISWGSRAGSDVKERIGIASLASPVWEKAVRPWNRKTILYDGIRTDGYRMNEQKSGAQAVYPFQEAVGTVFKDNPVKVALVLEILMAVVGGIFIYQDVQKQKKEDALVQRKHFKSYLTEDVMNCVGDGAERYLYRFFRVGKGKPVFHIWAVLFGTEWMAYRLMWKEALAFCILFLAGSGLLDRAAVYNLGGIGGTAVWQTVVFIFQMLSLPIYGFFADWLYWNHVRKILNRSGCQYKKAADAEEENGKLGELGGTSKMNVLLMLGTAGSLSWIVSWLSRMY